VCANLWVGFIGGANYAYTARKLAKSGTPVPIQWSPGYAGTLGLAFDQSKNLWAVVLGYGGDAVVRFTAAQLNHLKTHPEPTPRVIITSTSTFNLSGGCSFDHQGNLWIADGGNNSIDELSIAQLVSGSGDVPRATIITSPVLYFSKFVPL
jgi:sugar lactone lactonase YvrE